MLLRRLGAFFLDILEVVVFAVAIFLFVYLWILQPHKIKGESMMPNFANGEYLLTDKITYRFQLPKRGDVVIFEAPTNNGDEFIKRIIAIPDDKVYLRENKVYINGKILKESYLPSITVTSPGPFLKDQREISVPTGHYFVLGDNRSHSSDSRTWGFIAKEKITGRAWLVYWPPQKFGTLNPAEYNF